MHRQKQQKVFHPQTIKDYKQAPCLETAQAVVRPYLPLAEYIHLTRLGFSLGLDQAYEAFSKASEHGIIDSFFMHVDHEYPDFILHMDCFLCSIEEGKIVLVEHENAKWLTVKELGSVDWLPADVAVAKKLKQQL